MEERAKAQAYELFAKKILDRIIALMLNKYANCSPGKMNQQILRFRMTAKKTTSPCYATIVAII